MDGFTLIVAAALTAFTMAASMGLLYLASARQTCLADWGTAGGSDSDRGLEPLWLLTVRSVA